MIRIGSRYQTEPVTYLFNSGSGTTNATVMRGSQRWKTSYQDAVWHEGLRLDVVASKLISNGLHWWRIMDYNKDIIDPMSLSNGDKLSLP